MNDGLATVLWKTLQIAQMPELVLDFPPQSLRQGSQRTHKPPVVDCSTLIDHDLALLTVSRDPPGKRNSQQILSGESRRARQDPRRWMAHIVQQVALNHEYRPELPRLGTESGAEIGQIKRSTPYLHDSPRPSEASTSSSSRSCCRVGRVASEALR